MEREGSLARRTLQKARFFLTLAEEAGIENHEAFDYCFEATIVFGRSIAHHLRKQYIKRDRAWCRTQLDTLEAEPLNNFFISTRNFILKQGEVGIRRTFGIEVGSGSLIISGHAAVRVIRGSSWYKRHPWVLWEDFVRTVLGPWREWREARAETRRIAALRREARKPSKTTVRLYFAGDCPAVKGRPALELVHEFLRRLEKEVDTFEGRFGQP